MPSPGYDTRDTPYPGLRAFDETNARWFFGRDALIEALLARLQREAVLLVAGPSGSGKSSVVRAGLIPRLRATGVQVASLRPGRTPATALANALAERAEAPFDLLIDQFEELFTQGWANAAERDRFIEALCALIQERTPLILTLRSDFEGWLDQLPEPLPDLLANRARHHVPPMTARQIADAIETPARLLGFGFAGSWQEDLKPAALGAGRLPMAQFALQQAWAARDEASATLPRPAFLQDADPADPLADPLATLLASAADAALASCDSAAARTLFLHLVEVSPGGIAHDTKRKVSLASLTEDERSVVTALAAEGVWLLTTDAGEGGPTAEIAHEALIRCWPTLHGWLEPVRTLHLWQARCLAGRARDGVFPRRVWSEADVAEAEIMLTMPDCDPEAARYARQVLAYTQAASLWPMVSSGEDVGAGWDAIAAAGPELRAALLDQVLDADLTQFRPEAANDYSRDMLVRALFGVSQQRRIDAAARMAATDWSTLGAERTRFWLNLIRMLGLQCESAALNPDLAFEWFRIGLRVWRDGDSTMDLTDALEALAPRIANPDQRFAELLAEFYATSDYHTRNHLSDALRALAIAATDPDRRYAEFRERLLGGCDDDHVSGIGYIMAAFAGRLAEPDRHMPAMIEALEFPRRWRFREVLAHNLSSLAARVEQADHWTVVLNSAAAKARDDQLPSIFRAALGALAPRIQDGDLRFQALVSALTTGNYFADEDALWSLLVETTDAITDPSAAFEQVVALLSGQNSRSAENSFGKVLVRLVPRLSAPAQRIRRLQAAHRAREKWHEIHAFQAAIAALAPRLTDPVRALDTLIVALRQVPQDEWPETAKTAICYAVSAVPDADRRFENMVSALSAEQAPYFRDVDEEVFACLAKTASQPDQHFDEVLRALGYRYAGDLKAAVGRVLAELGARVLEPDQRFGDLFDRLSRAGDWTDGISDMGRALAGIASAIAEPDRRFADLLTSLQETDYLDKEVALGEALCAVAARTDQPDRWFKQLCDAVLTSLEPRHCRVIGKVLAVLAERIADPRAAFSGIVATLATPRLFERYFALCRTIRPLALRLPEHEDKKGLSVLNLEWKYGGRGASEQAFLLEAFLDFSIPIPDWLIAACLTRWASLSAERGYRSYPGYADPVGFDRDELPLLAEAVGLPENASVWAIIAWLKERRPDANLEAAWGEPILPELAIATPAALG